MSRAMVFASATLATTTLATTACGGKAKPRASDEMGEERHHGGGGCSEPDQAKVDELEKRKAEAQTEEEKAALDQQLQQAKQPVCMPYGAPPSRRRQV